MKYLAVFLGVLLAFNVRAETDPGDRFLSAYFLIQEGDAAEANSDWAMAQAKFTAALAILGEIRASQPDWHTNMLDFRSKYCAEHLAVVTPKVPAGTPDRVVVPPTLAVEMPAPPSEAEQIRQLQAELQKSRDELKSLRETRDKLTAELQAKLGEPAPTERSSSQEILQQLRAMEAVNEALKGKIADAESRVARADQLAGELAASQKRVQELEAGQVTLSAQLKAALAKVDAAQTSPQVEELLKKNGELTTALAGAQAEISKLRDQVLATPPGESAADTVKLRADLTQSQSDLAQTKVLLEQRTTELTMTRAELEKMRAENTRLGASNEEILAKLAESDRQLRAAKSSSEKNDQIITQLRKENELLQQIADRKDAAAKKNTERGGFLWFKPKKAKPVASVTNQTNTVQSEPGKLTATVKAPEQSESARAAAEETKIVADAAVDAPAASAEVRLLIGQGRAAMAVKDYATAKTHFTTALAKDPDNLNIQMALGLCLYQLNQLDEAVDTLRKVVATAPNHPGGRSLLGIVYLRLGRTEDAYNELTRAVAIDPRNAEAHNYLGIVMSEKGWATAAEQEIRRAIELNPQYADAHFNLAVIYSRQKTPRLELARYHYQKALDLGTAPDEKLAAALKEPAPAPKPTAAPGN